MAERVSFRLPLPPPRGNRRGHWRRHWRAERKWYVQAAIALHEERVRYPLEPWARTRVQCHFRLRQNEDPDNLDDRRKIILDLLKEHWAGLDKNGYPRRLSRPPRRDDNRAVRIKAGFFRDDSAEFIELLPSTQERVKTDFCVVLTLEQLGGDP